MRWHKWDVVVFPRTEHERVVARARKHKNACWLAMDYQDRVMSRWPGARPIPIEIREIATGEWVTPLQYKQRNNTNG